MPKNCNIASLIISIIILIIVIILIIIVCCGYSNYNNYNNQPRIQNPGLAIAAAYQYKMGGGNKNNFVDMNGKYVEVANGAFNTCTENNVGHTCMTRSENNPGHCQQGNICQPDYG